jgi:hypothetical protein
MEDMVVGIKNVKLMIPSQSSSPKNRVRVKSESGSTSLCFPSLPLSHSLYIVGGENKKRDE